MANSIGGIILAAGVSARMQRPKALLPWGHSTVVGSIIDTFLQTPLSPVVIVIREGEVGNAIRALVKDRARVVLNPDPERGMLSSLQCAAKELLDEGISQALITPVDQPQTSLALCRSLCALLLQNRWAIAAHNGAWGHPYAAADLREILQEESSAQHVLKRQAPQLIEGGAGVLLNLNTPEEYQLASSLYKQEPQS
jgi:molybdenum cofactor cytidylyltransferase